MKRLLVFFCVVSLASCQPGGDGAGRRFLSVGTGGTGGVYYPLGGALASRLSLADSNHQYTAEVTGGSVENVNRIAAGEMDLGFSMANTMHQAYNGEGDYAAPLTQIRAVAPLYPNVIHLVVPKNSSATGLADLRGGRVSVGSPGSGTEMASRELLAASGISYDDIDVRYLSFRESSDALRDRAIDAAIIAAGYPTSAVLEAVTSAGARLLPISSQAVSDLVEQRSYYGLGEIPAGAYPSVDVAVPTVVVMNWLVAAADLDASIVDLVLNTLRDERSSLERVHNIARQIDLTVMREEPPIPLHSAAARWRDRELRDVRREK